MSAVLVKEVPTFGSVFTGVREDQVQTGDIMCATVYADRIELLLNPVASMTINNDLRNEHLTISRGSNLLESFKKSSENIVQFKGRDGSDVFVNMNYRVRRNPLLRAFTPRTRIQLANGKSTKALVMPRKQQASLRAGLTKLRRLSHTAG